MPYSRSNPLFSRKEQARYSSNILLFIRLASPAKGEQYAIVSMTYFCCPPPQRSFFNTRLMVLLILTDVGTFLGCAYLEIISENGIDDKSSKNVFLKSGLAGEWNSAGLPRTPASYGTSFQTIWGLI